MRAKEFCFFGLRIGSERRTNWKSLSSQGPLYREQASACTVTLQLWDGPRTKQMALCSHVGENVNESVYFFYFYLFVARTEIRDLSFFSFVVVSPSTVGKHIDCLHGRGAGERADDRLPRLSYTNQSGVKGAGDETVFVQRKRVECHRLAALTLHGPYIYCMERRATTGDGQTENSFWRL